MGAVYPGDIRGFTTKIDIDDTVFALHINDLQDEVRAIQIELGTTPKGTSGSVRARMENIEATRSLTTHDHTNRLDATSHDTPARHGFGASAAFGLPETPQPITPGAVGAVGAGDNPANERHVHAFDTALMASAIVPPGTIAMYGGTTAPSGWVMCDGASYARGTTSADPYFLLFSAIGTAYGSGSGTTFSVPDLRNRFPFGRATPSTAVATGGWRDAVVVDHGHNQNSHGHGNDAHGHSTQDAGTHEHTQEYAGWMDGYPDIIAVRSTSGPFRAATTGDGWLHTFTRIEFLMNTAGNHGHGINASGINIWGSGTLGVNNSGVAATDRNLPPYQTVNFIIKL
ncbi:MAG TPA: tail fiber protein [Gemmatimonadales bacterium]|nr:tail fiber protein [Gemmatimonadales bacterium]